jgi:hypothetical protein
MDIRIGGGLLMLVFMVYVVMKLRKIEATCAYHTTQMATQ